MAPERRASPRMSPATPASRRRRTASRSVRAAGDEEVDVVARGERGEERGVRRGAAVGQHEPAHAGGDQLLDQGVERRHGGPPPRERGEPLGPRVQPHGEPVAGDGEALPQRRGPLDDRDRQHDARGPRREGEAHVVGLLEPARDLERDGDPRRHGAHRLEVRRPGLLGAVDVDEVGSRARPGPRTARR